MWRSTTAFARARNSSNTSFKSSRNCSTSTTTLRSTWKIQCETCGEKRIVYERERGGLKQILDDGRTRPGHRDVQTTIHHPLGWLEVEQAECRPRLAKALRPGDSPKDPAMTKKHHSLAKPKVRVKNRRINGLLRTSVAVRFAASTTTSSSALPAASCTASFEVSGLPRCVRFKSGPENLPVERSHRGGSSRCSGEKICAPCFWNQEGNPRLL